MNNIKTIEQTLSQCDLYEDDMYEHINEALHENRPIPNFIAEKNNLNEEDLLNNISVIMNLPFQRLNGITIDKDVLDCIPTKAIFQYNIIPLEIHNQVLFVACADPFTHGLLDSLQLAYNGRVRFKLSTLEDISESAKKFYGVGAETLDEMIDSNSIDLDENDELMKQDLSELDQEASVVKFVNQIIWEAYKDRSTDIHIEPMENDLRIRYRVDGVLRETPMPPQLKRFQSSIISRIKVMANMDIAEKRLPQDGRISLRIKGEEIDVRVSTMPTVYGESVSLRLLLKGEGLISMSSLGLNNNDNIQLTKMINRPHGILLVTGPTGSGKSTSLYAWLHSINSTDKRIMSAEDPIEYEMKGVNQVQMKPEIGLNFSSTLRTFLRQDPDVIMVGEIRDKETAEIAIRAALTGHLVFSTIHTNDSASTITRLLDMDIEPFLVSSSVEGIVAQRLIRKLCTHCRKPKSYQHEFLKQHSFPAEKLNEDHILYEAVGCDECRGTGYRGRSGIFEILPITEEIRPLIVSNASSSLIKNTAIGHGMKTLREDGWDKVLDGTTSVDEILRVTEDAESDD